MEEKYEYESVLIKIVAEKPDYITNTLIKSIVVDCLSDIEVDVKIITTD